MQPPPEYSGHRPQYGQHRNRALSSSAQFGHGFPIRQGEPVYIRYAMDQQPRFPPPPAAPQHMDAPAKRNTPIRRRSDHRRVFQLTELTEPEQLRLAVLNDPEGIFAQLATLLHRNQYLEQTNQHLEREVVAAHQIAQGAIKDSESRRKLYDQLIEMGCAKQLVLWKHIQDLQGGLYGMDNSAGLVGAKERFEQRELDREQGKAGPDTGCVQSPSKIPKPLGHESPEKAPSAVSDMISEESFGSPVRSLAGSTVTLFDPTAHSFIPGRFPAPKQYHSEVSNYLLHETQPPPIFIQTSHEQNAAAYYVNQLPSKFRDICPISISHDSNISPKHKCDLLILCQEYSNGRPCSNVGCPNAHEYRSCTQDILHSLQPHVQLPCKTAASRPKLGTKLYETRMKHIRCRAHNTDKSISKNKAEREEWHARMIMMSLIPAHLDGKY